MSENCAEETTGRKRGEGVGGRKELHNKQLHNLYTSPYIIKVVKSRRMRLTEHAARTGDENTYRISVGNLKGRDHSENLEVDGKIILEWILEKQDETVRTGHIWLEKPRNCMGRDLNCVADVLMRFHRFTSSKPNIEFNSTPHLSKSK